MIHFIQIAQAARKSMLFYSKCEIRSDVKKRLKTWIINN